MATQEQKNSYQKAWCDKNREKVRASRLAYNRRNKDSIAVKKRAKRVENRAAINEAKRRWAAANPEKVRAQQIRKALRAKQVRLTAQLKFHYGIGLKEYERMLAAQGGRCAICWREKSNGRGDRLHIDHDHATGVVRGLLCNRCNSAIGYFDEQPVRLRRAASYIKKWRNAIDWDRCGVQPVLAELSTPDGKDCSEGGVCAS